MKKKMAFTSLIVILLSIILTPFACAEVDPVMTWVVEMAKEYVPNRNSFFDGVYIDVTGISNPMCFDIEFDWREGNESIRIVSCYEAKVYTLYPATTLEKIQCLFAFLNKYEEISAKLPQGVELSFEIIEADGSKHYINASNYQEFRTQLHEALGVTAN